MKALESKQHLKQSYVAKEKEMCLSVLFTENTTSLWAIFIPPNFSIDIQDWHLPFPSPVGKIKGKTNSASNCFLGSRLSRKQGV